MTFSRLVVAALCRIQHVAIGQKYENKYDSNYQSMCCLCQSLCEGNLIVFDNIEFRGEPRIQSNNSERLPSHYFVTNAK